MSVEESKALVRHYLEEVYRGNFDTLDTVLSPSYDIPGRPGVEGSMREDK